MELDTTKLSQAGSRKLTPHDNCIVLDLGTGSFPRLVELRLPGVDGARQSALWDGSLDLAVDDIVIADEYAGQTIWRISAMGGGDSGAGKVRVSKVWESDFEAIALQADATGQIEVGKTTGPDAKFEIVDTAGAQLRLTHTDASKFVDFALDTNHDLTVTPSSDGEIVLQQKTITAAAGAHRAVRIEPTYDGSGSGQAPLGIVVTYQPSASISDAFGGNYRSVGDPGSGVTITRTSGNLIRMDTGSNGGSITQQNALRIEPASYGTVKPVTARGVHIRDQAASGITTVYGLHIEGQTGATNNYAAVFDGTVGVGTLAPLAQIHIDQSSTTAAIPVAYFDQADISEEMFEFNTTIGTGNAIEAKGLKLLTTTHFVKTTIPGGLTRYFPVGTIDTVGPKFTRSSTLTTRGLGANPDIYAFGFYNASSTDANLTQASTTQAHGTANLSYAAHAFVVTGGAGSVDTGVVGLRVNGTSINDQGTRTTSDTETIIADITAVALDEYAESDKKWLGTYTYELFTVSGSPTTFSLDFNFGRAKYDDWFNTDFTITDIESVGFAGANDSNFDIKLIHHQATGWTYAATGFSPVTAANTVASLVGDHSTDDQLGSSQHMAWKRDDLSEAIDGADGEGFLVFVSSSANNAIEYLNIHIGVVF